MAWYNSTKDLGRSLGVNRSVADRFGGGDKMFGDRNNAGVLGTGQYRTDQYQVDESAFGESPEAKQRQIEFANALPAVINRQAPQMNEAQANQWRAQQNQLAGNLQATLRGEGPSVAQLQMQQGLNQSLGNAASMAASQRGVSPAMAMRLAQQNQAQMAQNTVGQSGMLRAQEQMAARGELAGLANAARTQDLNVAAANQRAAMEQGQLNDNMERFFREGQMGMDERNRQAKIERERMKSQNAIGTSQVNAGAYQAAAQNRAGMLGGIGAGIGAAVSIISDERLKTDIQKVDFDSPANWGFQPSKPSPAPMQESSFEPTREAASKESTKKFLNALQGSQKGDESPHNKMGQSIGMGLAAAAMALSDKNAKTGAKKGNSEVQSFLDAIDAYTYRYKDPAYGEGKQLSPMAQDLEKTPIGKELVVDTPEGKMIDYGKAGGVMMASQAMLNDRLRELEKEMAQFFKAKGNKNG
jgi:hypothetical protein